MILVFLTLFIALSIVFIYSGSCPHFFLLNLFVSKSGTQTDIVTKSVLSFKAALPKVLKSYSAIFKNSDPYFSPVLSHYRNRKLFFFIFTSALSGL